MIGPLFSRFYHQSYLNCTGGSEACCRDGNLCRPATVAGERCKTAFQDFILNKTTGFKIHRQYSAICPKVCLNFAKPLENCDTRGNFESNISHSW